MKEDSAHVPVGDTECTVFKQASVTDGLGPTFHDRRPQHGKDCATYRERWSQTPPLKQICEYVNFAHGVSISVIFTHGVRSSLNWSKCQGHMTFLGARGMTFCKCEGHDLLLITHETSHQCWICQSGLISSSIVSLSLPQSPLLIRVGAPCWDFLNG